MAEEALEGPAPGLITRWFGIADEEGFGAAIKEALKRKGPIGIDDIRAAELTRRYRVSPGAIERQLAAAVSHIASDFSHSDFGTGIRAAYAELAARLRSTGSMVSQALQRRASEIYSGAVESVIADGETTEAEVEYLRGLASTLDVLEAEAISIYGAAVQRVFNDEARRALEDGMLSPEEDAVLERLFKRLKVQATFDADTKSVLASARTAWEINHGQLPEIDAPVALQRNEVAYAVVNAAAYEQRTRTTSIRYGGPAVRIKIMKGVSYRAGGYRVGRSTEDYEHLIGRGPLVVTNKRLIFAGDARSMSPRLDSILQIESYSDGVAIVRSTGKPLTFRFENDDPWFGAILQRARNEF